MFLFLIYRGMTGANCSNGTKFLLAFNQTMRGFPLRFQLQFANPVFDILAIQDL